MYQKIMYLAVVLLIATPVLAVETFKVSNYGGAHQLWFEAEDFDERDPDDDSSFALSDEPGAFGRSITNGGGTRGAAMMRYDFDISKAGGTGGTWYFWGRIINPDNRSSFMLVEGDPGDPVLALPMSLGNEKRIFEQSNLGNDWVWAPTPGSAGEESHTKTLKNGLNTMYILNRESRGIMDVFMWTDDPDYVPTNEDYENAAAPTAGTASGASPGAGAADVIPDIALTWKPGEFAVAHNVYFGTGFDDVNTATVADPLGVLVGEGQDANSYDPEGVLAFGETYYWRVDEVNGPPDRTVIPGEVWSFEVEPLAYPVEGITATASSSHADTTGPENTINGSGLDALNQHDTNVENMWLSTMGDPAPSIEYDLGSVYKLHEMRVWNSNQRIESFLGLGAKEVVIEYSTDGAEWMALEGPIEFTKAPGADGYTANTVVELGVVARYVKINVLTNHGMLEQYSLSEVKFSYIPVNARELEPIGPVDSLDIMLKWRPGREAVSHEVVLSADEAAVMDGSAVIDTVTGKGLDISDQDLRYGTVYYWRVNEVNEAGTPPRYEGQISSFTTPDFGTVDDFDQYDNDCMRIFFAWADGLGHSGGEDIEGCNVAPSNGNGGGSTVGNDQAPFAETTIVNAGSAQSMPFNYDNAFGPSEARLTLPGQDWTANGVKTLAIAFSGTPGNTGTLYVKINNTKVVYDLDPTDIAREGWQAWNIDLTALNGLQNVTSLTIGVDGTNAAGMLYIDDIRLYPLSGELITPVEPGTANLLTYYDFDEGAGSVARDASTNGHDATLVGPPQWVAGKVGGALSFGNGSHVLDDDAEDYVNGLSAITITMWIKSGVVGTDSGFIIFDTPSDNDRRNIRYDADGGEGDLNLLKYGMEYTSGNEEDESPANLQTTDWQHVAVTSASGAGLSLYINGTLTAPEEDDGAETGVITGCTTLIVGKGGKDLVNSAGWDGLIDEVRIYGRALSAEEVMWLAGRTESVHRPL